jgi:hypothetical protein
MKAVPHDRGIQADGFRSLADIYSADPRHNAFLIKSIGRYHAQLNELTLNRSVPANVQVSFDTARNLCLYSWFVYRFSTVARFQAYATLEYAIKARAPKAKAARLGGLKACIDYAIQQKWFKDEGIRQYRRLKVLSDESSRFWEHVGQPKHIVERAPDEWLKRSRESFPGIRNEIAHGTPLLLGDDFTVLEMCCDLINQLFPATSE